MDQINPDATFDGKALTSADVRTVTFDTVRRGGYETGQVDDFIERVCEGLATGQAALDETRRSLSLVTDQKAACENTIVELNAELDRSAESLAQARDETAAVAAVLSESQRENDVLAGRLEEAEATIANPGKLLAQESVSILTMAHVTAEQVVAKAREDADRVLAEAQAETDRSIEAARVELDGLQAEVDVVRAGMVDELRQLREELDAVRGELRGIGQRLIGEVGE